MDVHFKVDNRNTLGKFPLAAYIQAPKVDVDLFRRELHWVSEKFESEALRAEKMFYIAYEHGGDALIVELIDLAKRCTPDLGIAKTTDNQFVFRHVLLHGIDVTQDDQYKCLYAVHMLQQILSFAALPDGPGEEGHLDFVAKAFDTLVDRLRATVKTMNKLQG
jgi:hypothetical protein